MNNITFIEQMRRSLASIDDYTFVNDTIAYYENYIESQIRMGKTEEQVMQELGDPRLIAKSIVASHVTDDAAQETEGYGAYKAHDDNRGMRTIINLNGRLMNMPSWLLKILTFLVVIVVVVLLFTILKVLSPIIILACFGYMIYRMITGIGR